MGRITGFNTGFLLGAIAIVLLGCGGGNNAGNNINKLSGTAATGLPIANATISVKDKRGNKVSETTSQDGKYSVDVTSMTAPYLIKVGNLYSIATKSGIANVHPFSDMIIRNWFNVQGLDVDSVFAGTGTMPSPPTEIEIATIELVVRQILTPYMSVANVDSSNFNLITSPFNADHTGFDAVLDTLIVTQPVTPGGVVTIANSTSTGNILSVQEATSLTAAPTVTGFSQPTGSVGTLVTISGTNFSGSIVNNSVSFGGGINATITAATNNSLTVSIPSGAITGQITVTTLDGTATSADTFTVSAGNNPSNAPTIISVTPTSGSAGTPVTISGANFSNVLADNTVLFSGGISATVTAATATSLTVTVPSGITTGAITIATSGGTVTSTDFFTATDNPWSAAGNMTATRSFHSATILSNGKVLVTGGEGSTYNPLSSADLYDPATNAWSGANTMATVRSHHTSTLLPDGKALISGGWNGFNPLTSVELYDPSTNTWSTVRSLTGARFNHTATLLPNGKVLVAGGANSGGAGALASAELYDPASNTWSAADSMATARHRHTATLLPNGKVLVAGGANGGDPFNSAELYDPASNTWSAAASMTRARGWHTATLLSNGNVLMTAGYYDVLQTPQVFVELYDPATNTWSAGAALAHARYNHTATLLSNGKVLVVAGRGDGGASVELYDPSVDTWSTLASMVVARIQHTATLLSSGAVLIAGGANPSGTPALSSSEHTWIW
jgi:N-acetylneuraminic acid mutarotase